MLPDNVRTLRAVPTRCGLCRSWFRFGEKPVWVERHGSWWCENVEPCKARALARLPQRAPGSIRRTHSPLRTADYDGAA